MRIRLLGAVGALSSSLLLSGCAGAMMAMGPVSLPATLLMMGPMEEMGLLDGLDGMMAVDTNPALRNHPALADARLSAQQAELIRRHAVFTAEQERRLSSANALDCSFEEDTLWLFVHNSSRRDYEEGMASLSADVRPRVLAREAALLEGECVEGRPEGAFVAVARQESAQGSGNLATWSNERRRLAGTMREGRLEGELLLDTVSTIESASMGRLSHSVSHAILAYEGGQPTGRHLHLTFSHDKTGEMTQVLTQIHEFVAPNHMTVTVYAGDSLFQEYSFVDGQMHGWSVMHPVEFVRGYPSDAMRICYRYGQEAPDAACAGLSS